MENNEGFVIRLNNAYMGQNDAICSKIRSAVIYHDKPFAQHEKRMLLEKADAYPEWRDSWKITDENLVVEPVVVLTKSEYDKLNER